jgi:hypothetical protein
MNDSTAAAGVPASEPVEWEQIGDTEAFSTASAAGVAMVARQADGLWLPLAVPARRGHIRTGEPCASLQTTQRQAKNALT